MNINSKVLVTGGFGFIGRHLVQHLIEKNHKVVIVDRPKKHKVIPSNWKNRTEVIWSNIENIENYQHVIKEVNTIYHLAGVSGAEQSILDPFSSLDSLCRDTLKILEACWTYNPHVNFIYPSSRLVYGCVEKLPVKENANVDPTSIYGLHKLMVENYIKLYSRLYNLNSVILRITNPYGPTLNNNSLYGIINWFIHQSLKGETIKIFGDGSQIRDYIYIDDLVDLLLKCKDIRSENIIYNVGSGNGISISEMVKKIISYTGTGSYEFEAWGEIQEFVETGDFIADITDAKSQFNWAPVYTLDKGIKESVEKMKLNFSLNI